MRLPIRSGQFRRDLKRMQKRGKKMEQLRELLLLLLTGDTLPERYEDHPLKGNRRDYRDAHVEPDWLLIDRVDGDELQLVRTGTHADLFDE